MILLNLPRLELLRSLKHSSYSHEMIITMCFLMLFPQSLVNQTSLSILDSWPDTITDDFQRKYHDVNRGNLNMHQPVNNAEASTSSSCYSDFQPRLDNDGFELLQSIFPTPPPFTAQFFSPNFNTLPNPHESPGLILQPRELFPPSGSPAFNFSLSSSCSLTLDLQLQLQRISQMIHLKYLRSVIY